MLGVLAKITASYKKMDQNLSLSQPISWITLSFCSLKIIFPLKDDSRFNFQDFSYREDTEFLLISRLPNQPCSTVESNRWDLGFSTSDHYTGLSVSPGVLIPGWTLVSHEKTSGKS